jgi:hemerythrin-like domain-containing protein
MHYEGRLKMKASQMLTQQHRSCDQHFADCESLAHQADWSALSVSFAAFVAATEHHLSLEEQTLFPAFEQATGMLHGPTEVMRGEHREMRELLAQLQQALNAELRADFLGLAETLLMLTQQHNMKEENMLYPMCQAHIPEVDSLVAGAAQ